MIFAKLIVKGSDYSSNNTIQNTIHYITRFNDNNIFFYGNWPPTADSAISLFENLRTTFPESTAEQQVQHFIISFESMKDLSFINSYAEQIASLLASAFPVCFATHTDKEHYHTHFIVSTTSYIPGHKPLTDKILQQYINSITNFSKSICSVYLNICRKTAPESKS